MHFANYICIISPYPKDGIYLDGWMSRIKTIDLIVGDFWRCYIDFQVWYPIDAEPETIYSCGRIIAYRLNPHSPAHREIVGRLVGGARFTYIHTLHQCEYMLDFFEPAKMIVDIHGIVPEEEALMGSEERSILFQVVEKKILEQARWCVVVTRAMAEHYQTKYPLLKLPEFIHVPVFDFGSINNVTDAVDETIARRADRRRPTAIYAGGSQVWQRCDLMIDVMSRCADYLHYEIYTHNILEFNKMLRGAELNTSILRGNVPKHELVSIYRESTFGFALRDDDIVNRVACPTKICDYCANMVIPIMSFTDVGDFQSYGFQYLELADLLENFIPDADSQRWMMRENLRAMDFMFEDFKSGAERVLNKVAERVL